MNQVGRYAASEDVDDIELMKMVMELPEKDKMIMWSQGYMDLVIEKLPEYARDILEKRKNKWEDTLEFYRQQIQEILSDEEFIKTGKGRTGSSLPFLSWSITENSSPYCLRPMMEK